MMQKTALKSLRHLLKCYGTSENLFIIPRRLKYGASFFKKSQNEESNLKIFSSEISQDTKQSSSAEKDDNFVYVGRDFISLKDFHEKDIKHLIWTALDLKDKYSTSKSSLPLTGLTAAFVFTPGNALRKVPAESSFTSLGGHAVSIYADDLGLTGSTSSTRQAGRFLSSMCDIIVAGFPNHDRVEDLAADASVPVINAFSDVLNPLQALSDLVTLQEYFGYLFDMKIACVGSGSNSVNSLLYGCAKLGINLSIATPVGYEPHSDVLLEALRVATKKGCNLSVGNNPVQALYKAEAVIVDSWISGPGEENRNKRLQDFTGFQLQRNMLEDVASTWVLLHNLPQDSTEVSDDLFFGTESLVWKSLENRKWAAMAVLLSVLQPYTPNISYPTFVRGT